MIPEEGGPARGGENDGSDGRAPVAVAYVGVGSNIDPERNVPAAVNALARRLPVTAVSTFYRTPPVGAPGASHFYNGVVVVEAVEPLDRIAAILTGIERDLGRDRVAGDPNAPREIDLDLLLAAGIPVEQTPPVHPDVRTRAFVAQPLLEVAPDLVLPGGDRLADLARAFDGPPGDALPAFTEVLRGVVEEASGHLPPPAGG